MDEAAKFAIESIGKVYDEKTRQRNPILKKVLEKIEQGIKEDKNVAGLAHSIAQTGQKEKIAEKPLETYHNAKDRLKQRLEEKNNAKPNNPKGHTLVPSRSNNRDSR